MNKNLKFYANCLVFLLVLMPITCFSQADSIKVKDYLSKQSQNEVFLNQFFSNMPKGGDIHNHLTGAVYAETYFTLAAKDGFWVNMNSGKLYSTKSNALKDSAICPFSPLQLSPTMTNLHNTRMSLLNLWSIRDFIPSRATLGPDEFFFGTFGLFSAITGNHMVDLLKELKNRASVENVQYLEIMASSPKVDTTMIANYGKTNKWLEAAIVNKSSALTDTLTAIFKRWELNPKLSAQASKYVLYVDSIDSNSNLTNNQLAPVCLYQAYASRNADPLTVYAQLYLSFKACADKANKKLVGVNIVSAENSEQSMTYYSGHMLMFKVLKGGIPSVKTSLHAGELTMGLVMPEDLNSHIREAVTTAGANRIGHGVDIAYEKGSSDIIKTMKNNKIAVEINLVSNEFILQVEGSEHPFQLYFNAGVPLVISTDDAGILRTNLAQQYMLLEMRYKPDYYQIKQLVRNGISYSFAPDEVKKNLLAKLNKEFASFESQVVLNSASKEVEIKDNKKK